MRPTITPMILILTLLLFATLAACGGASEDPTSQPEDSEATSSTSPTTTDEGPARTPDNQRTTTTATASTSTGTTPRVTSQPANTQGATTAPDPAPTTAPSPTPETGGICDRHESVRSAILRSLDMSSCSQVTENHLAQVTELDGISVTYLPPSEVAGLSNLEVLSLTIETPYYQLGDLASLKRADVTIQPPSEPLTSEEATEREAAEALPDFFRNPFEPEYGTDQHILDEIKLTVYPDTPGTRDIFQANSFFRQPALRLHLVERRAAGYASLFDTHLDVPSWHHVKEIRIELDPVDEVTRTNVEIRGGSGHITWLTTSSSLRKFTVLNHHDGIDLRIDRETFVGTILEIRIQGFDDVEVSNIAFSEVRRLETLHLDAEDDEPHALEFRRGMPPPTGSGFVVKE